MRQINELYVYKKNDNKPTETIKQDRALDDRKTSQQSTANLELGKTIYDSNRNFSCDLVIRELNPLISCSKYNLHTKYKGIKSHYLPPNIAISNY